MQNNLYEQHKDCEMIINYARCNAHQRPSLCCAEHKDKHGRPQWIDWVCKESEDYLIEGLCCDIIGEPPKYDTINQALNLKEFMKKNNL